MPDVREKQHEARRKIIRQWMALPKDKRQTAEQAAAFTAVLKDGDLARLNFGIFTLQAVLMALGAAGTQYDINMTR